MAIPKTLRGMIPPLKRFETRNEYENDTEASVGLHFHSNRRGVVEPHSYMVIIKRKGGRPYYWLKIALANKELEDFTFRMGFRDVMDKDADGDWAWQGALSGGILIEAWPRVGASGVHGQRKIEKAIRKAITIADSQVT